MRSGRLFDAQVRVWVRADGTIEKHHARPVERRRRARHGHRRSASRASAHLTGAAGGHAAADQPADRLAPEGAHTTHTSTEIALMSSKSSPESSRSLVTAQRRASSGPRRPLPSAGSAQPQRAAQHGGQPAADAWSNAASLTREQAQAMVEGRAEQGRGQMPPPSKRRKKRKRARFACPTCRRS